MNKQQLNSFQESYPQFIPFIDTLKQSSYTREDMLAIQNQMLKEWSFSETLEDVREEAMTEANKEVEKAKREAEKMRKKAERDKIDADRNIELQKTTQLSLF